MVPIVLFKSVLSETDFRKTSDLDLAVWDLPPSDYINAVVVEQAIANVWTI
jgi:predicted nucleotidyltransferase